MVWFASIFFVAFSFFENAMAKFGRLNFVDMATLGPRLAPSLFSLSVGIKICSTCGPIQY